MLWIVQGVATRVRKSEPCGCGGFRRSGLGRDGHKRRYAAAITEYPWCRGRPAVFARGEYPTTRLASCRWTC